MGAGDVNFTSGLFAIDVLSQTNVAVNRGDVVQFNTDGWAQAVIATGVGKPFGIWISASVTATAATQKAGTVLLRGVAEVTKVTGALDQGDGVMITATDGEVGILVSAGASYTADEAMGFVGTVVVAALSGDATVKALLGA